MKIGGLVLAGGRSRRFGSEKAVALLDGRPLIAHVAAVLDRRSAAVAINAPWGSGAAAWAKDMELPVLPDPAGAPDGPLSGVREGLRWAAREGFDLLAVAPCDTPRLPPDVVLRLVQDLAFAPDAGAAVARTPAGVQPLCALWRTSALASLDTALAGGAHPPVHRLLAALGAVEAAFPDDAPFANLNTPERVAGEEPHRHA